MSGGARSDRHLLLVAGAGGLSPVEALRSAATVTSRVSVVHLTAWQQPTPEAARRMVGDPARSATDRAADGAVVDGAVVDGEWLDAPDVDAAVAAVRELHARRPIHGSVTHSELLLALKARIDAALGLPGNSPEVTRVAQSKLQQRRALAAAGLPVPAFREVTDRAQLDAAAAEVGFPLVLKPVLGAASLGVVRVDRAEELPAAWEAATGARLPFLDRDPTIVVEGLLHGVPPVPGEADYCSVESVLRGGVAHHLGVVDRLPLRHGFVEEGALFPSALPDELRAAVQECATASIAAVGLVEGAAHTEVKLTPDGPVCIEVNARLGGPVGHLFREASDNDLAATISAAALGLPFPTTATATGGACFRSVPAPPGRFRVVAARPAEELLERHDGLVYVRYRAQLGGVLDGTFPHVVSFLVRGADRADAQRRAAAVEDDLGVRLAPLGDGIEHPAARAMPLAASRG